MKPPKDTSKGLDDLIDKGVVSEVDKIKLKQAITEYIKEIIPEKLSHPDDCTKARCAQRDEAYGYNQAIDDFNKRLEM